MGYVTGNRVNGFDFTCEAVGSSGINQRLSCVAELTHDYLCIHQSGQRRSRQKVGLKMGGFFATADCTARFLPRFPSAIKHRNLVVADPLQHPPQTATVIRTAAVINHRLHFVVHADAGQPGRKPFLVWQRVTTSRCRCISASCSQHTMRAGCAMPGA